MNSQKIINLVKNSIKNPGQMIQIEKDSGISRCAGFAVKTEFSIESYYVFLDEFYLPDKNGVPSEFKLAGVYIPENNTIYDSGYALNKALECSKEFISGGSFELIRTNIYKDIARLIVERYAGLSVESLSEMFGEEMILSAQEKAEKYASVSYKLYNSKVTDNGFKLSDFTHKMFSLIEAGSFDDLITIEDLLAISVRNRSLDGLVDKFVNSESRKKIVERLFDIRVTADRFNAIFEDKKHRYNMYCEMNKALEGKETVIVRLNNNYDSIDMRFPVSAFRFEDDYLNVWALTSSEMRKVSEVFDDIHYIPLTCVKEISYRNKPVWKANKS